MLRAFIDESEYQDKYFTLSALIVSDEKLPLMERELQEMMQEYSRTVGIPVDAELHGHDLMQQSCDWKGVHMNVASSIYLKSLGIINRYASALYIETIDREAQRRRYRTVHNHRRIAIGYILERINEYAGRNGQRVEAYLDDHYTAPAGRREFLEYKQRGTFGYRSSQLPNVTQLDFYDSRKMWGLQASDLCCYIYNRQLTAKNANKRVKKLQDKMWKSLESIRWAGRTRVWPKMHEYPA